MTSRTPGRGRKQTGAAAVELALVLPVLITLLAAPLLFGRVFLHHSMAQKAAHDAARFLANAPQRDISWRKRDGGEVGAATLAREIARSELAEANTGFAAPSINVFCDGEICDRAVVPARVQVIVKMDITDVVFTGLTGGYTGDWGIPVRADVTMAYVGK